jgi:putative ABC transport system substrate-binding protein
LAALAAPPLLAGAAAGGHAQTATLRRVAFANPGSESGNRPLLDVFLETLKEKGHVEGRTITVDVRWASDRTDRLPAFAAEVVATRPDVIVTASSAGVAAFKAATSSIPIVFATATNPVEQRFVASLQRPGGNVTGVAVYLALTPKLVEVTREALPKARRLALMLHERDPISNEALKDFEPVAKRLRFEPVVIQVRDAADLGSAFAALVEKKVDAAIVAQLQLFGSNFEVLGERAVQARIPLIAANIRWAGLGAVVSYGTDSRENYRRAAAMVDGILRGAKPADMPVEQPERFQMIVNRRIAKQIGVEVSQVTMLRADRVID